MEDDGHPCCLETLNFKGLKPLTRKDLEKFLFYTASYDENCIINYYFIKHGKCLISNIQEIKQNKTEEFICCFDIIEPLTETKTISNLHITPYSCEVVKNGKVEDYFSPYWRAYMSRINGVGYLNQYNEDKKKNFLTQTPTPSKEELQNIKEEIKDEKISTLIKLAYFNQVDMTFKNTHKPVATTAKTKSEPLVQF